MPWERARESIYLHAKGKGRTRRVRTDKREQVSRQALHSAKVKVIVQEGNLSFSAKECKLFRSPIATEKVPHLWRHLPPGSLTVLGPGQRYR